MTCEQTPETNEGMIYDDNWERSPRQREWHM